jgi:hypothetical protein
VARAAGRHLCGELVPLGFLGGLDPHTELGADLGERLEGALQGVGQACDRTA